MFFVDVVVVVIVVVVVVLVLVVVVGVYLETIGVVLEHILWFLPPKTTHRGFTCVQCTLTTFMMSCVTSTTTETNPRTPEKALLSSLQGEALLEADL